MFKNLRIVSFTRNFFLIICCVGGKGFLTANESNFNEMDSINEKLTSPPQNVEKKRNSEENEEKNGLKSKDNMEEKYDCENFFFSPASPLKNFKKSKKIYIKDRKFLSKTDCYSKEKDRAEEKEIKKDFFTNTEEIFPYENQSSIVQNLFPNGENEENPLCDFEDESTLFTNLKDEEILLDYMGDEGKNAERKLLMSKKKLMHIEINDYSPNEVSHRSTKHKKLIYSFPETLNADVINSKDLPFNSNENFLHDGNVTTKKEEIKECNKKKDEVNNDSIPLEVIINKKKEKNNNDNLKDLARTFFGVAGVCTGCGIYANSHCSPCEKKCKEIIEKKYSYKNISKQ